MKILNIANQEIVHYPDRKIVLATIETPFYCARKIFDWNMLSVGISLNKRIIDFAVLNECKILVKVNSENAYFMVSSKDWKNFCENTNSIYRKRLKDKEILLYVYPLDEMEKSNE